jgi:hypothetical protein
LIYENLWSKYWVDEIGRQRVINFVWELWFEWENEDDELVLRDFENEADFTQNFLIPFFKKMWYDDVRYTHWIAEYWKDIVMRQKDLFWNRRYIWVQAKVWKVSWKTAWHIDELVWQANDWFAMPVPDIDSKEKVYISEFIIVTDSSYSWNAKEKILTTIKQPANKNNITFLDKTKIENMLYKLKYWET